ncbi:hypothetical protein GF322_03035 [Candidatus Dependentiae bacterium]|nr:hypothetical protein [Candidatus Dependentiae bacterium]
MKKIIFLTIFSLIFININSVCSALTVTIKRGTISGFKSDTKEIVEVKVKVDDQLKTSHYSGFNKLPITVTGIQPGQKVEISARIGKWIQTGIGESATYLQIQTITIYPNSDVTYYLNANIESENPLMGTIEFQ